MKDPAKSNEILGDRKLVANWFTVGPATYLDNISLMREVTHSYGGERVSFRPATTAESLLIAVRNFEEVRQKILGQYWLQLGWVVKTSEGIFANPPLTQGRPVTDLKTLKSLLNQTEKVNGIYLGKNDFGFAPYETFKQGVQNSNTFVREGLARALEHVREGIAENFRKISSPQFYKKGVDVLAFSEVREPVLRVVGMCSGYSSAHRLSVDGDGVDNCDREGYAFGC